MSGSEKSFRRFLRGRRAAAAKAYASGDGSLVTALSVSSGPATFLGPGGGVVSGAKRVIAMNEGGARRFAPAGTSRFRIVQAGAVDGLAFWTGIQSARVRFAGKSRKAVMQLRVTEVFRQQAGEWKLVHRHADMLTKPGKGK